MVGGALLGAAANRQVCPTISEMTFGNHSNSCSVLNSGIREFGFPQKIGHGRHFFARLARFARLALTLQLRSVLTVAAMCDAHVSRAGQTGVLFRLHGIRNREYTPMVRRLNIPPKYEKQNTHSTPA